MTKCKDCKYFDGSHCVHDDFFIAEDKGRLIFKQRYVNEDDFCSWAEEGELETEGELITSKSWTKNSIPINWIRNYINYVEDDDITWMDDWHSSVAMRKMVEDWIAEQRIWMRK